jgi:pimeloyl-ACP methyl ester carboxylesterase
VNGVTLHCAEAGPGDGPLIVLLHGFPEFWFAWRDYFGPFAENGYHVVAPDQRGYNLSDKPLGVEAYRLDVAAADVFALADVLGRRAFHVVGHDWGASVAWRMASQQPERLLSAAMLQAPHPGSGAAPCARIATSGRRAATCRSCVCPGSPKWR